jgi:ribosome biogenesis GTPase
VPHDTDSSDPRRSDFEPLVEYGWDQQFADEYKRQSSPAQIPGRIIRVDRGMVTAASPVGAIRCHMQRDQEPVAVGDWICIEQSPNADFVIASLLPRRTAITRADPLNNRSQVLAANVDLVLAMHGLDRDLRSGRVERVLVVAWEAGATPVLLLTKSDLDPDKTDAAVAEATGAFPGVEVLVISSKSGAGIETLAEMIGPGITAVAIGESGVGKSTLANRLLGSGDLDTGFTRDDGAGRHTTTVRELIPLPAGGVLIDTPGLRALGLWEGETGVAEAFADIEVLAQECRFRDCGHGREPGCEVAAAISDGRLAEARLESYHRLQRELDHQAKRADERTRRAELKSQGKAYKLGKSGKEIF